LCKAGEEFFLNWSVFMNPLRLPGFLVSFFVVAGLSLFAQSANAATFLVNTTADALDVTPGNGACVTASGGCSLRAAVQEANALGGVNSIVLPAGIFRLTKTGVGENNAVSGGSCAALDQRGAARPFDGNLDGVAVCDIGAYESTDACPVHPNKTAPGICGCGVITRKCIILHENYTRSLTILHTGYCLPLLIISA
jgi:CSLREA domain-containing protein